MKTYQFFFAITIASLIAFSSCKKDEGKLPNISFKKNQGYIYADDTVGKKDTLKIGIDASKSEEKDLLKTFNASRSYDGGALSTFINESLTGSQGDSYSRDIEIVTRDKAGTEKYVFTVTNRDGLSNQVSLTLTVK